MIRDRVAWISLVAGYVAAIIGLPFLVFGPVFVVMLVLEMSDLRMEEEDRLRRAAIECDREAER